MPFPCTVPGCEKKYSEKSSLRAHLFTHEKKRQKRGEITTMVQKSKLLACQPGSENITESISNHHMTRAQSYYDHKYETVMSYLNQFCQCKIGVSQEARHSRL